MRTRRKNYSLTDLERESQGLKTNVKGENERKVKVKALEKEKYSHSNKYNRKRVGLDDEVAEEKSCSMITMAKNKTTNIIATENNYITTRKGRSRDATKTTKPVSNNLQNERRKPNTKVKQNSSLSKKISDYAEKNNCVTPRKGRSGDSTKPEKNKLQNKDKKLKEDVKVKENNTFSNKDSKTVMKSNNNRKYKQEKNTDIVKNNDMENAENNLEQLDGNHIPTEECNIDIAQEKDEVTDVESCSNITRNKISRDERPVKLYSILRRKSTKHKAGAEIEQEENIEATKNIYVDTMEDIIVEPVEEKQPIQEIDILKENNLEIPETPEENDKDDDDDDDDDDCPEEVTFGSSREEAMESLKLMKREISKIKNEQKETRKRIQDRNILQKNQKKDKADEIRKKKLPPELLDYVSKFPRINKDGETGETIQTKQERVKSMAVDEDEKHDELIEPVEEDFISLHGSTEFRACHLEKIIKGPKSVAASITEFKERQFLGNKRNKREPVWEIKSKMIKQAAGGKL